MTERTASEEPPATQPPPSFPGVRPLLVILAAVWLLLTFDLTRDYSPTIDEVPHAGSGWAVRSAGDFRVNPEHPPLWKFLSAVPQATDSLPTRFDSAAWEAMTSSFILEWPWSADLLYGGDPDAGLAYIRRARLPIILFGLLLGTITVAWSARLGGSFAALLAALIFALEPNLLAHSSLLTSDIPFTAMLFLTLYLLARSGSDNRSSQAGSLRSLLRCATAVQAAGKVPALRRFTASALIGLALGLCLATKFTALILPPIVAGMVLLRPFLLRARGNDVRLRERIVELIVIAVISWATLWLCYGLRYAPTPEGDLLDVTHAVRYLEHKSAAAGTEPDGPVVSFALFAERYRLLPQAYCVGLIWAKATTLGQPAFLLGEISTDGWWYYFPITLLVKTSTLLLLALVFALLLVYRYRGRCLPGAWNRELLIIAPAAVLIIGIGSGLNIGLRHVLPVIPSLIILVAVATARGLHTVRSRAIFLTVALLAGAAGLSRTHPHELSYFNLFAGGQGRGIELLSDSNLDWGQDLERLGRWSAEHPCTTIHLAYYGSTPPAAYGVDYEPMPVRDGADRLPSLDTGDDAVIIVSSRYLQGLELNPEVRPFYDLLRQTEPSEVIGTTLYVYRIGPQASCAGG